MQDSGNVAQAVIVAREATHGDYSEQALASYRLKGVMSETPQFKHLTPEQSESLDMIATKVSRILCGNPNDPDHWCDIAGYATLVYNQLTKGVHL